MTTLRLSNRAARRLWLDLHGLLRAPTGPLDVTRQVEELGFVQLDSIRHVERAHEHIMWSRNRSYRPGGLEKALRSRGVFEHFTHDASLIPMRFLPMWARQFRRRSEQIVTAGWWQGMPGEQERARMRDRIAREGPLSTKDFESDAPRPDKMWHRPPHKLALDYMWYAGELATSHRENFVKHYDLAERVFPEPLRAERLSECAQVDWLCRAALSRLGVATAGEIMRFWEACTLAEVQGWLERSKAELLPCTVETAQGEQSGWALPGIEAKLGALKAPGTAMRLLSPFDPAIRDRKRTERLFGFAYRIEIFVPAAKRRWGYYVYPVLQGDRLVARLELEIDRKAGELRLARLWPEAGLRWSAARQDLLDAELARFARFAGLGFER